MKKISIVLVFVLLAGCNQSSLQDIVLMDGVSSAKTTTSKQSVPNKQIIASVSPFSGIKSDSLVSLPESPLPSVTPSPQALPTPSPVVTVSPEIIPPTISEDTSEPAPTPTPSQYCDSSIQKMTNYEQVNPVPVDVKTGNISLFFWDKYKVRLDSFKKVFISQAGADVSKLNKLIKDYNITKIYSSIGTSLTQIQADQQEQDAEAKYCGDWPNQASMYSLRVENINIKEFVEKMRTDIIVRSCNYSGNGLTAD